MATNIIKYLIGAWGIPVTIILVVLVFTPSAQDRTAFTELEFVPTRVWVAERRGRNNTDHFELRIRHPDGTEFFHRDPEPEPIVELYRKFPEQSEIQILYWPTSDGNVLMEIVPIDPTREPILSLDDVLNEYASRRRVVYIVAGVWCLLANLLAYALWKVDIDEHPGHRKSS